MFERTAPELHADPPATPSSATESAPPRADATIIAWEPARLKAIMPRVVSRAMSYSAMARFDAALVASVQRFYGLDVDVATAETEVLEDDIERVRFFPWFLWDFAHASVKGDGARASDPYEFDDEGTWETVGRAFLREGDLSAIERRVVAALNETAVDFWEITAVSKTAIEMKALGLGAVARIEDETLAKELLAGQILQARIVLVPSEVDLDLHIALIDAVYAVLPASTRAAVVAELDASLGTERLRREGLKRLAPELIDFAEYLLESANESEAAIENTDGETMILCSTLVPPDQALALEAGLLSGELGLTPTATGQYWIASEGDGGDRPLGFVWHDSPRGRWLVGAQSRERLARLATRLRAAGLGTAQLHAEETLERAAVTWIETGVAGPHLTIDPEVAQAFERWLAMRWIDTPHPILADSSPRAAARNEALRPALEALVKRVEGLLGRPIGSQLGLC